jgi:hypothetical protein
MRLRGQIDLHPGEAHRSDPAQVGNESTYRYSSLNA